MNSRFISTSAKQDILVSFYQKRIYGLILLLAGIAYLILQRTIIATQGHDSLLAVVGRDVKGKLSPALYFIAIVATTISPRIAWALYFAVALMWLIPDRRIERTLAERTKLTERVLKCE